MTRKRFSPEQIITMLREQENSRLKKLVANLSFDNAILKKVNRGNF